jgi:GT2 family glycosyltransferase
VISSLDEGEELRRTLESVFSGLLVPAETIVVDDGSSDGSCEALATREWRTQGVTVHRIKRSGIAAARNVGAGLAQGTDLIFLDAHCRFDRNCLAILQAALAARPDAILAPAICELGTTDFGCGARLVDAQLRTRWLLPGTAFSPVPVAPGGCLGMSRATFERLRGFGAFRELGLEDVDFSLRAWRFGVDVLAVPTARVAHRFRTYPPYRLSVASRAYNVARVVLIHFDGARREECLRGIVGTPRAADVLVDAFTSDWQEQRDAVTASSTRSVEAFFEKFEDWR